MPLRPYQTVALDGIRAEMRAGKRAVLLVSPTGSGKTQIAAEMIRSAVALGNDVLFVAHRRELVLQAVERLRADHAIESGILMAGHARRDHHPVQVASIQTLARRTLPPARLLICDEAHHAAADSWRRLLDALPDSRVVGLTASPWRLDGRGLGDVFESIVVAATPGELLEQGYLCQAVGHAYLAPDFAAVATKAGDYDPAGLTLAYRQDHVLGDIVDRWLTHCGPGSPPPPGCGPTPPRGRRTILFAASIEISTDLVARFRSNGVAAEHLDYHATPQARRAIVGRVRAGETTVISNVGILGEGVDVPELECAILARPTKSLAVYLQQIGRVLRPAPGKARAIIHDHAGCIARHGFWDQDRDYSLATTRPKQPGAAPVKNCPECLCCCAAGCLVCPECGCVFPTAERGDGPAAEHKELTLEELRAVLAEKSDVAGLFRSLALEARASGKRPGWVIYRLKDLLGDRFEFPAALWRASIRRVDGEAQWRGEAQAPTGAKRRTA